MKKAVKSKKTVRKTPKRRKITGYSDAIRAFILVGAIVVFSALISCAVIMVHSSIGNDDESGLDIAPEISKQIKEEDKPVLPPPALPAASVEVSVEPSAPQNTQPSASSSTPSGTSSGTSSSTPSGASRETRSSSNTRNRNTVSPPAQPEVSAAVTPRPPRPPVENIGTLVFVIDDAGNNLRELEPFLQVPGPLTIAVLPGLPHSAEAARRIRAAGKEVILHQPMEAIGAQDPGPGAIYTGMSGEEVRAILARNVAEIGPVTGINNHQGSKVTMDREIMETVLSFCRENRLYFLDSRTTADSVVPTLARQMGIKIAERNVFIDNEQNKDAMLRYISGGLIRAQRNGLAVMIGHTWSPDLAPLLTEQFPLFVEQGYTIKTALDIIKQ